MKFIDALKLVGAHSNVRIQADYESQWGSNNPYGSFSVDAVPWLMVELIGDREVVCLETYVDGEVGYLCITYKGVD